MASRKSKRARSDEPAPLKRRDKILFWVLAINTLFLIWLVWRFFL